MPYIIKSLFMYFSQLSGGKDTKKIEMVMYDFEKFCNFAA